MVDRIPFPLYLSSSPLRFPSPAHGEPRFTRTIHPGPGLEGEENEGPRGEGRTALAARTKDARVREWVGVRAWVQKSSFHPQIVIPGPQPHPFPLSRYLGQTVLCSHSPWLKSTLASWKSLEILTRRLWQEEINLKHKTRPDPEGWKAASGVQFRCFSPSPGLEMKAGPGRKPNFCPEDWGRKF